ncbi:hypothetical protein D3C78_1587840 [compost metagenome]
MQEPINEQAQMEVAVCVAWAEETTEWAIKLIFRTLKLSFLKYSFKLTKKLL